MHEAPVGNTMRVRYCAIASQFLAKKVVYPMVTLQRRGSISGPDCQGRGVGRGPKETMWRVIPVPTGMIVC